MPRSSWWSFSKIATRTPITIGDDDREQGDRAVLAVQVGDGALEDAAGDVLHLRRALVPGEHIPGQPAGEDDCDARRRS